MVAPRERSHACRGACENQIPRREGHVGRKISDNFWDGPDHLVNVCVLAVNFVHSENKICSRIDIRPD